MIESATERRNSSGQSIPGRSHNWAGALGIIVSALLFAGLYSRIDGRAVWDVIRSASPLWLILSTGAIVPLTLTVALRFYLTAPPGSLPGYAEAVRLSLVATALNMFLPSKSGDLVKSYFVTRRGGVPFGIAVSIVVYERLCDLFGLTTWCIVGVMISPPLASRIPSAAWIMVAVAWGAALVLIASDRSAGWLHALVHWMFPSRRLKRLRDLAMGWPDLHRVLRGRRRWIVLMSVLLWLGHLTQMYLFALAVSAPVAFATGLGIFALALVAGQLPFTFAGVGARDVALVVLLSGDVPAAAAAAVGLLSVTRGALPALAAVPIIRPYVAAVAGEAARWRKQ